MIYFFIGQPTSGKTTLGKKLHKLLKTEIRNWKHDVFHIDGDEFRELYKNTDYTEAGRRKNILDAQRLAEFLHTNGCDVVVSLVTPYLDLRESFKEKIGNNIVEIFLHTTEIRGREHYHVPKFETPESNFIDIDTTKHSPELSFSKLINNLKKIDKL